MADAPHDFGGDLSPVFDPTLDPANTAKLKAHPGRLLLSDEVPQYTRMPSTLARVAVAIAGVLTTAAIAAGVGVLALLFLPQLALAGLALLGVGAVYVFFEKGGGWGTLYLIAAAAVIASVVWLGPLGVVIVITAVTALAGLVGTAFLALRDHDHRLPSIHHGRYLVPLDFGDEEQELLRRVQRVRNDMEAMRPQFEALRAAMANAERRVAEISDYGDKIALAVTRQREWDQVQRTLTRDEAYGALVRESASNLHSSEYLRSAFDVRALAETRDESVRAALSAGRTLTATEPLE